MIRIDLPDGGTLEGDVYLERAICADTCPTCSCPPWWCERIVRRDAQGNVRYTTSTGAGSTEEQARAQLEKSMAFFSGQGLA